MRSETVVLAVASRCAQFGLPRRPRRVQRGPGSARRGVRAARNVRFQSPNGPGSGSGGIGKSISIGDPLEHLAQAIDQVVIDDVVAAADALEHFDDAVAQRQAAEWQMDIGSRQVADTRRQAQPLDAELGLRRRDDHQIVPPRPALAHPSADADDFPQQHGPAVRGDEDAASQPVVEHLVATVTQQRRGVGGLDVLEVGSDRQVRALQPPGVDVEQTVCNARKLCDRRAVAVSTIERRSRGLVALVESDEADFDRLFPGSHVDFILSSVAVERRLAKWRIKQSQQKECPHGNKAADVPWPLARSENLSCE